MRQVASETDFKKEMVERFLDYIILPSECIDTLNRNYIDNLEIILEENHLFDFGRDRFSNPDSQRRYDKVRDTLNVAGMRELIAFVRENMNRLDIANRRARISFDESIFDNLESYRALKPEGHSVEKSNEFQKDYSAAGVANIPTIEKSADAFEIHMSDDRVNPWTYLIRRGGLSSQDATICIGNRWLGEILYFRENLGLLNTKGVDLFTAIAN